MTELLQDIDNLELLLEKLDKGDQLQVIKVVQKMIADKRAEFEKCEQQMEQEANG
tara:strand:+ start:872 stop:1036 length:165 start_codon:yes stop_codon:yes gene_type:complete